VAAARALELERHGHDRERDHGLHRADDTPSINGGLLTFSYLMACERATTASANGSRSQDGSPSCRVEVLTLTGYANAGEQPAARASSSSTNALLRTAQGYLITKYRAAWRPSDLFRGRSRPGIATIGLRGNRQLLRRPKLQQYRITAARGCRI